MAANLTFVAIQARKGVRYGIYFFVALIVGRFLLSAAISIYNTVHPKPPPPPTVGFNVLPAINYPDPNIEYPELKYTVETPSGELPKFPNQMKVFLMPQRSADLYSYDNMIERAKGLGFTRKPRQKSANVYVFDHPQVPATFETDIINQTFSLSYNLAFDSSPLNGKPANDDQSISSARTALSNAKSFPDDMSGPTKVEYLKAEGQNLVKALSLSDAQLVQINFYRKDVSQDPNDEKAAKYPTVTSNYNQSNVWVIVSEAAGNTKNAVAAEYKYYPVDYDKFETYPVKTAQQALDDLNAGKAFISNLGLNTSGNVTIRKIYLAYYDSERPNQFFQPVVVFEDESTGFRAFVPAVTNDYYGATQKDGAGQNQ